MKTSLLCPLLAALTLPLSCATVKPLERPPATQLDADTELHTASGASVSGAKGWFVSAGPEALVLEEPDHELTLALLETPAHDATAALDASWKRLQPDFKRKVLQKVNAPPREGWDEIVQAAYVTSEQESRVVMGIARRKGDTWYLALIDGKKAALDRRGAQLSAAVLSLKPKGVEKESFAGRTAAPLDAARLDAFVKFVEEARVLAKVPGAAVTIVRDGNVVLEKGFGVREIGKADPVTPKTLFMIGSTTKSLTTFMMAKLVDEGRMTWATPVTDLLPTFALADADVTHKLTLANTVCACAGLPRQDMEFLFEYARVTPEMRMDAMKTMHLTTGFGETFQYSNSMVAAGGYAAAHALDPKAELGPGYDAALQSRVLTPLGMVSTTSDFELVRQREHASPHGRNFDLTYTPMGLNDEAGVVPVRPAGAVWSNVADMGRFVRTELASGKAPDGTQVVSPANLLKRRDPQVKITDDLSYGLGLFVENDHGVRVIHHGGNNLGFTSDMFFLPDSNLGVVVLTNAADANAFRKAVRRRLLELLFEGHPEAQQNLEFLTKQLQTTTAAELKHIALKPDADWLKTVTGHYTNGPLGPVDVRADADTAVFDAGEWKSSFGKKTEPDGSVKLILTSAPLTGLELLPQTEYGRTTLTLNAGQQQYVFAQAAR